MKRTLQEWANLAEIIGSVAIITSLIFVGLEVRQNTVAIQSSAAQSVHENFAGWYLAAESHPELLAVSTKGIRDYDSLTFSCGDLNYLRIYTYATVSDPGSTSEGSIYCNVYGVLL